MGPQREIAKESEMAEELQDRRDVAWNALHTIEDGLLRGIHTPLISRETVLAETERTTGPRRHSGARPSSESNPLEGGPPSRTSLAADVFPLMHRFDPLPSPGAEDERRRQLAEIERAVRSCTECKLHTTRTNAVPGVGNINPLVMVIGEGPGADEDAQGIPFVGRAGHYLDKWLEAISMSRKENVYIANIVKCRPPGNRDPQPDEATACTPFLERQVELVRPRVILTVGRIASRYMTGLDETMGRLRERTYTYRGIPLVATYHPSAVLRNQILRRPVWEDMKRVRAILDAAQG